MIEKIKIYKLFNFFTYEIELNEGGITILTGPNGYGKTTILRIIYAFANGNFSFFFYLIFEKIEFTIDGIEYKIEKDKDDLLLKKENQKTIKIAKKYWDDLASSFFRHERMYERLEEDKWIDRNNDSLIDSSRLFEENPEFYNRIIEGNPKFYREVKHYIPENVEAYLIREQRLLQRVQYKRVRSFSSFRRESLGQFEETIEKYANQLKNRISSVELNYSQISQELDSSFPKRLFEQRNEITEDEFNRDYEKISRIQKSLVRYGISVVKENELPVYKEENSKALSIYVKDTLKKLGVFSELIERLDLFTNIMNDRLFSFKKIQINKNDGFRIVNQSDETLLALTNLSSGEKQEIVMFYELLFETKKGILVLIDEPEISLHVAWQKEFLSDMKEIVKMNDIYILIATHSPQIIGNNWDLTVDLEEIKA